MEMAFVIQRYWTGLCALLFLLWFSLPLSLGSRKSFPIEEYITYNTTYMHEYGHYYCFCQRNGRNLNTKSLVVLAMAPRKQKTVESGGIGLMSDGREAHSVPFPIWRKFINRLALAALAHCNDNVNDDGNLRIGHSEKILLRFLVATLCGDDTLTSSKSQYFLVSTRVLSRKYSSTWP